MGLFRDNETNKLNETQHGLKSQLVGDKPVRLFYSVAEDFNSKLPSMQLAAREELELGASALQVQRPNHSVVICLVVLFAVFAIFKAETRLVFSWQSV